MSVVLAVVVSSVVLVKSVETLVDSTEVLVASSGVVSVSVDEVVDRMKAVVDSVVPGEEAESIDEKEDTCSVDTEVEIERADDRESDEKGKSVDGVLGEIEDSRDSVIIEVEEKEEPKDWEGIEVVVGKIKEVEYSVVMEDEKNEENVGARSPEVAVVVFVPSIDCVDSIATDELLMDAGKFVNTDEPALSVGNNV